ncbi:hypothetical protein BV20DRAFT_914148, partial [Pilatotrama ljubarskyi]
KNSKKKNTIDASQPAFKPRQVKKGAKGDAYRDRATERRLGIGNDYAQVEALAEEFERRNADNDDRQAVEEQRKYLGGDSEHTVLVKGLDFALLEQARARAAAEAAATEDVSLEQAYLESAAAQPKKRTREEILRELKSKRGGAGGGGGEDAAAEKAVKQAAADKALEEAKKAGKFKPIGFKPVGGAPEKGEKAKRKKKAKAGEPEENGERKKKRKVTAASAQDQAAQQANAASSTAGQSESKVAEGAQPEAGPSKPPPAPEPEPVDEDFDIFADAGEYTGVDLGDESDDSDAERPAGQGGEEEGEVPDSGAPPPRKWLATSDDERESSRAVSQPPARSTRSPSRSASPQRRAGPSQKAPAVEDIEMEDGEEEERPVRLQPLASSALPSIKDLLAMSEEAEKAEKRRLRKEKKKGGGGGGGGGAPPSEKDTKAKVERDYQRLKAYTDKKA